ncbi:MAG: NADH-quinone oxidoreductase subunit J [Pseudomonadota bacterium]
MIIASLVFYLFAAVLIFSAIMVIGSRNPVHSVLFLILAFFNAAGLFVLIGAEYLAMTLVIVYVGAVAVLFLFVVMMLDIDFVSLRQGFMKNLPLGLTVALIFLGELLFAIFASFKSPTPIAEQSKPIATDMANTQMIGSVLYTDYMFIFQISGLILLVAMISAIVLTLRTREGVRRQVMGNQSARKREDTLQVIKVKSGQGA